MVNLKEYFVRSVYFCVEWFSNKVTWNFRLLGRQSCGKQMLGRSLTCLTEMMMTGKQTRTLWMMSQKRSSDGALAQWRALDALLVLLSKWEFFKTYFTYVYFCLPNCDMWQHASFLCILWKGEWSYIVVCIICKISLYCTLIFNSSMWLGQPSVLFKVCLLILVKRDIMFGAMVQFTEFFTSA